MKKVFRAIFEHLKRKREKIGKKYKRSKIYRVSQYFNIFLFFCKLDLVRSIEMTWLFKKYHIYNANNDFLQYFAKEYDNIKAWIESKELKNTYIMPPPPLYPPLLNPKEVDYTKIPAHIAWELNLPLPPYYKFIYFGSHATGNRGLNNLILNCGGMDYVLADSKKIYINYYEQIMSNRDLPKFGYLSLREYVGGKDAQKFYALIPKSKALNLVRDPISTLKSGVNFRRTMLKEAKEEKLHFSLEPDEICENLVGYIGIDSNDKLDFGGGKFPCVDICNKTIHYRFTDFLDTDLRKDLINIADEDIICIDMSEIVGERAFETIKSLAKAFDFPPPKDKEKCEFHISLYEGLLPLVFEVPTQSRNIKIHLMDKVFVIDERIYVKVLVDEVDIWQHKNAFEHYQDITQFLFNQDSFYERIIVCIEKKDFEILKQDTKTCEQIKEYLLAFIPRLEEQRKIEEAKRFSEKDILEYLKSHKDLCLEAKAVFEKHLAFLASVRPDIIESWKYYQEFLAMCEEMSYNA